MPAQPTRLLIVSNRLPVTVCRQKGSAVLKDSAGGLATGLRGAHESGDGLWVGWTGEPVSARGGGPAEVDALLAGRRLVPVHLTLQEVRQYYEGFSNSVIWPLFHYLLDRVPLDGHDWPAYKAVNEKFAEVVARHYRPGDVVWVHDYQLMLLPAMLRERLPGARIGFFLHIPFPSSELFRVLPRRRELLAGVLGADLVGFHTFAYARHFRVAIRHILGLEPGNDRVAWDGREVKFGPYPMGIDAGEFERTAMLPGVREQVAAIKGEAGDRLLVLGIDRLDYTKGIPRRLLAFERLLEMEPDLRDRVRLLQVAVPSRSSIPHYQASRKQIEEIVGRINGRFGTIASTPVHYLYQSFTREQLVAMYLAADVMAVTPLRDGMNLVAKEFVASRLDGDGVLVLSEFTGAASELAEALSANPYDVDEVAGVLRRALTMQAEERAARMRIMRERVMRQTAGRWVETFVRALAPPAPVRVRMMGQDEILLLADRLRGSESLELLLDYDGTLVPLKEVPGLALPDAELLRILQELATHAEGRVHMVSGRRRDTLEQWLGHLPVQLWAEHGLWHRSREGTWTNGSKVSDDWMASALRILEGVTARTPGSLIEPKHRSIAWHYRMADPDLGRSNAQLLRRTLGLRLRDADVEILKGHKVIEVRPKGVNKGSVVQRILAGPNPSPLIVAIGDDRTDEDMFAALPQDGISVRVGAGPSQATHRLADPAAVRKFLTQLIS